MNSTDIMVSVFCLAYNHERHIRDALDGFLRQRTNFKFEVLIHDDASTDNTAALLREYEEKYPDLFKVTYQTENQYSKKINNVREFLLPKAQGKYFAWCEGDDYWTDPYKLQKQVGFLESHPEYTMCMHRAVMYDWSNHTSTIIPTQVEAKDYSMDEVMDVTILFGFASTMVPREIFEQLPEIFKNRAYTDVPLRIYATTCGKIHCLHDIMSVYNFRTEGSSMERVRSEDKTFSIAYNRSAVEMLNDINEYYGGKYEQAVKKRLPYYEYHLHKHLGKLDQLQGEQYDTYRIFDQKRKEKKSIADRWVPAIRFAMPSYEEYCEEIRELWERGGPVDFTDKREQLQKELEEYCSVPNVTLVANAHLGLEMALAALELPKGGEVITTPFASVSASHAITRNGLRPIFCDINDRDYTIDVTKIEALITDKTCAILADHVFGNMSDVCEIQRIADRYGLKTVYNAAHAFGVSFDGASAASFGDAAVWDFEKSEVFHTIEGGAVVCGSRALRTKVDLMKGLGLAKDEAVYVGGKAVMNEFQAAMGLCNLRYVEENREKRKAAAERYRSHLLNIPGLYLCPEQEGVEGNYAYLPVCLDPEVFGASRDEAIKALSANYIWARRPYSTPPNTFHCYAGQYDAPRQTPVALRVSEQILILPLYADLTIEEVDRICGIILGLKKG